MVCKSPGVALGILTADCAPVLFADRKSGIVGAAHAGWKGAVGGAVGGFIVGSGGALIAGGAGLTGAAAGAATIGVGAASGAGSSVAVQGLEIALDERESISGSEVVSDAVIGAVSNVVAAPLGNKAEDLINKTVDSKLGKQALNNLKKEFRNKAKSSGNLTKKQIKAVGNANAKSAFGQLEERFSNVRAAAQSGFKTVAEGVFQFFSGQADEQTGDDR